MNKLIRDEIRKDKKERIMDLHKGITTLEGEIKSIICPHVEEGGDLWFVDYVCMPTWDCKESPVGWCVYNKYKDPALDNCIFCGEPYERK